MQTLKGLLQGVCPVEERLWNAGAARVLCERLHHE